MDLGMLICGTQVFVSAYKRFQKSPGRQDFHAKIDVTSGRKEEAVQHHCTSANAGIGPITNRILLNCAGSPRSFLQYL